MPRSSCEAHLTVRCPDGAALDRLRRWSAARGPKLTHVVLARGGRAAGARFEGRRQEYVDRLLDALEPALGLELT